jgi:hypothetical protein
VIAAAAAAPQCGALATLDSRDLEILELLAQGLSTSLPLHSATETHRQLCETIGGTSMVQVRRQE